MITGIQITKAANDDLLNSFWLLDSEKGEPVACVRKAVLKKMTSLPLARWAISNTVKSRLKRNQKFA